MKKKKEIPKDGYDFYILYLDNYTSKELINQDNCEQLIELIFRPNTKMVEREVFSILEKYTSYFLSEIKIIISENEDFYNTFDVNFYFNRKGVSMVRQNNLSLVIRAHMYLQVKLKE